MTVTPPALPVFGPITFPRFPMNNITPFTYRDGWTFLELIEKMRTYVREVLVPGVDANFAALVASFQDALDQIEVENNATIAEFNVRFDLFVAETQLIIDSLNNLSGAVRSARAYGAVGNGTTDDVPAIQAAVDACPDGGTVIVEPGIYLLDSSTVMITGKSITLDLTNATIIHNHPGVAFHFRGVLETPLAITTISDVVTVGDELVQNATQIVLPEPVPWERGDIVKMVADDVLPGSRYDGVTPVPATFNRVGQFFTVQSVDGSTVVLMGRRRDPMTTNLRIARMLNHHARLVNGEFVAGDDFIANDWNQGAIQMTDLFGPRIDGTRFLRTGSQAVSMASCYTYVVDNVLINFSRNTPSDGIYGYGINDTCSEFGKVQNSHFNQIRHAFTTGANPISPNSQLSIYGRTYGAIISSCTVESAQSAGFDVHLDADNVTFADCNVSNSPTGYSLRGRNHRILGCAADNVEFGLYIFDENLGFTYGHVIDGFTLKNAKNVARVQTRQAGHPTNPLVRDIRPIYMRNFNVSDLTDQAMLLINTTIIASNWRIAWVGVMPVKGIQLLNSWFTGNDIKLDFHNALSSNMTAIFGVVNNTGTSVCRLALDNVDIDSFSTFPSRVNLFLNIDDALLHAIHINNLRMPYEPQLGICNQNKIAGYIDWFNTNGYNKANSQYAGLANADLTSTDALNIINRTRSGDFVLNCIQTSSVVLAALPDAGRLGQRLVIMNNGTGTVTVPHGVANRTFLQGNTNKVLADGQGVTLVFSTRNVWVEV